MPLAFTDKADFLGMTKEQAKHREPFCLSEVVHQTYVEVSEEGTKAAAATAVVGGVPVSVHIPPNCAGKFSRRIIRFFS